MAGVAHELRFAAVRLEGDEHLLGLPDWAAFIRFALDDERGRARVMRELRGRVERVLFARLVRFAAPVLLAEDVRDVARAEHRLEVEAGGTADRRAEAVVLGYRAGGHEAAVAVAVDAGAFRVHVWAANGFIDHGHDVQVVLAAPVAGDLRGEIATVAAGAARVTEHDEDVVRGEDLLDGVETVTVVAVRAAVDIDDEGILLRVVEPRRVEEPGFDNELAAADVKALPVRRRGLSEHGLAVVRDRRAHALFSVEDRDLADLREAGHGLRDVAPGLVRAHAAAQRAFTLDLFDLASFEVDDVQPARPSVNGVEEHVALIQPGGHRWRDDRRKAAVRQALEVCRHPPRVASCDIIEEEIGLPGEGGVAGVGDLRAVRRPLPGGDVAVRAALGHRVRTVRIEDKEVAHHAVVRRNLGADATAVRRPARAVLRVRLRGELLALAAGDIDHEELAAHIAEVAKDILLVVDAARHAHGSGSARLQWLALRVRGINARDEDDARAIRRPGDVVDGGVVARDFARFAAFHRQREEARRARTVRGEGQGPAIRGPARRGIPFATPGEPSLVGTVHIADPYLRIPLLRGRIGLRKRVGDVRTIRRDLRVASSGKSIDESGRRERFHGPPMKMRVAGEHTGCPKR